jgi:hypothetical protein
MPKYQSSLKADIKGDRLPYRKPALMRFGRVTDLTANGSGRMSEDDGGAIDCSKNKIYVAQCMGA